MKSKNLTTREIHVLGALIDCYVRSATPVSSRRLASRYRLGISPATIRNTLQDLEEYGLVYQPHTSAGRIPTERAYRLYVDNLMEIKPLDQHERDAIKQELLRGGQAIDQILEQCCRVLSDVSEQLGLSMAPRFTEGILTKLEMIPVAERRLLVVVAVKSGLVKSVVFEVDSAINPKMIEETAQVLNEKLVGLTLGRIITTVHERFQDLATGDPKLIKLFTDSAQEILSLPQEHDLYMVGAPRITAQPEFRDPDKLQKLINLLEERTRIIDSLNASSLSDGVVVTIGKEANLGNLEGCSMVTSTYKVGKTTGTIGVIGPTRMQYSKLMSIIDYTSKLLSEILSRD